MTENEALTILKCEKEHHMDCSIFGEALLAAIKALEEIQQYQAIGTVEECRETMERQEPMCLCDREAPFIGKSTQIQYRCPQCDIILGIGISEKPIIQEEIRHCFNCGQKLYR